LQLAYDPVGVSGASDSDTVTAGLAPAPSACSFWRRAETARFTADAASHTHCKVGAHVMGFSLGEQDMQALGALVQTMTGVSYIMPEEVPALPRLPEHKAWHYTPLSAASSAPELVLLWIDGRQVMLIQEAMGSAQHLGFQALQREIEAMHLATGAPEPGGRFGQTERLAADFVGIDQDDFHASGCG